MDGAARTGRALVVYSVLRLLAFVVPFLVVWGIGGNVTVAAIIGAVVGLCVSVIFLTRQRGAVSGAIAGRVDRRRADPSVVTDEDAEDRVIGDQGSSASAAASPKP